MKLFTSVRKSASTYDNRLTGFTIFVVVICLLNLLINNINHRFFVSDFKVYYYAAKNLLAGGKVYFIAFGEESGFYKYSPFTLLLFVPYNALNFTAAAVVHFLVLSFAYWYTYILIREMLAKYFFIHIRNQGWLLSLSVVCTLIFLVKELYLGNINILLIMFCLMALDNFVKGRHWAGGILIGIVILTKPFFLILILPLFFRKKFKALTGMVFTVIAGLIVPFIFLGFQRSLTLFMDWINAVMEHSSDFPSLNSIDYLLHNYFFPGLPGYAEYFIILVAGILMIWLIMKNLQLERNYREKHFLQDQNFIFEWFMILAMLPDIVKTDTEHFLASAPIITFIIFYIAWKRRFWLIPVMVILFFFFGGNSQDILGAALSKRLFYMGLIGFSNLVLIALALWLYLDFRKINLLN